MAINLKRETVSYIVRIWAEHLNESPPRWRGVVEPVGGGEKIHFTELAQIIAFIQQETTFLYNEENKL